MAHEKCGDARQNRGAWSGSKARIALRWLVRRRPALNV